MWSPFQTRDLPALLAGAVVAAVSGLLLGSALHPNLGAEGLMAPQTQVAGGGQRTETGAGDPGLSRYQGPLPEYVTGTDATRPPADFTDAAPESLTVQPPPAPAPQAQPIPPVWRDPPQQAVAYPSDSGGVVYETDLPPPPPPPPPGEDVPG